MGTKHPYGDYEIVLDGPKDSLEFLVKYIQEEGWSGTYPTKINKDTMISKFYIRPEDYQELISRLNSLVLPFGLRVRVLSSLKSRLDLTLEEVD